MVPADCVLISLGMEHVDVSQDINDDESESNGISNGDNSDGSIPLEIVVDSHSITGESKPRHVTSNPSTCTDQLTTLYYGSRILEGACIALVTSTGSNVVLAQLIRDKKWPPQGDLSDELLEMEARDRADDEDVEAGIALLPR